MSKRGSNEILVEKQSLDAHTFKAKSGPVLVIHGGKLGRVHAVSQTNHRLIGAGLLLKKKYIIYTHL
jgi:hypothetical protein